MELKIDTNGIWYHGSNMVFSEMKEGSTITQWKELAEAFSHKPSLLSYDDNGTIYHNGTEKDAWIRGDFASGFVIKDGGERPELIIKFYMQGMGGHADTFGYILMHLTLNSDETWNHEKSEFVLDE